MLAWVLNEHTPRVFRFAGESVEAVNAARAHAGLDRLPSDVALDGVLVQRGFTGCGGRPYLRLVA